MKIEINKYQSHIKNAIEIFWNTRNKQKNVRDAGNRSAVTGGKQLDGFIDLLSCVAIDLEIPKECIYTKGNHIPGYFRPTKDWDMLIISPNKKLIAVVELKPQVGSFSNNFNNRTEESVGNAIIGIRMNGGLPRFQSQTLKKLTIPILNSLEKNICRELITSYDAKDLEKINEIVGNYCVQHCIKER